MWVFIGLIPLLIFILIFREIRDKKLLETVTKRNRGTRAERDLVLKFLKYGIPAQTIFHDLYVKKLNGGFSQIDLAVATKIGIIVLEVKDYSGWIFGAGHQPQWTQVLAYGKRKYRLYNPIMQNSKHFGDLKKQLRQFQDVPFFSIVVFYGDCVLKDINFETNRTFLVKSNDVLELIEMLMANNELARYTNKNEIVRILKEAVKNGEDKETQIQHIRNVREMLGKYGIFD
jgi:hypothetical protein